MAKYRLQCRTKVHTITLMEIDTESRAMYIQATESGAALEALLAMGTELAFAEEIFVNGEDVTERVHGARPPVGMEMVSGAEAAFADIVSVPEEIGEDEIPLPTEEPEEEISPFCMTAALPSLADVLPEAAAPSASANKKNGTASSLGAHILRVSRRILSRSGKKRIILSSRVIWFLSTCVSSGTGNNCILSASRMRRMVFWENDLSTRMRIRRHSIKI